MRYEKRILVCAFMVLIMILTACGAESISSEEDEADATLDLETLTAETESGTFRAQGTEQDPDASADWVVLSDGRLWGCACLPPYSGPCCRLGQ